MERGGLEGADEDVAVVADGDVLGEAGEGGELLGGCGLVGLD